MYADTTLSTADQPAGPIFGDMGVRQLTLPVFIGLARLGVETHFRDERLGPLVASWTVHQRHAGTPTVGVRLEKIKMPRGLLNDNLMDPTLTERLLPSVRRMHNYATIIDAK